MASWNQIASITSVFKHSFWQSFFKTVWLIQASLKKRLPNKYEQHPPFQAININKKETINKHTNANLTTINCNFHQTPCLSRQGQRIGCGQVCVGRGHRQDETIPSASTHKVGPYDRNEWGYNLQPLKMAL